MDANAPSSSSDPWAPREGEVVGGRYRVMRVIGRGGMGAVVAAEHVTLGEAIAIKFLHPKLARDSASVERFFREAKAATRIKSEHVVRVLDVGQTEAGIPFIVMELLRGADLGQVLGRGPLAVSDAVDFLLQAGEALAEAHAAGIVHRDLKPSNLWLSARPDGSPLVKVLDFGISKLSAHAPGDPKLTETQSTFGSPTYMSPEQIRSAKKVDHRTDVWALGVVLHELLTGKLPFEADTVSGVLAAVSADPPIPLRALRPDAPPEVEAAILACLQKDVSRRCGSVAELAALLAPFASQHGKISADRISRIGGPSMSLLPPAASSGSFSVGGVTQGTFSTAAPRPAARKSPLFGVALGMGLALVLVGLFFGARSLLVRPSGPVAGAPTGSPSASAPFGAAVPHGTVAAPSTSVALVVAPTAPAPTGTVASAAPSATAKLGKVRPTPQTPPAPPAPSQATPPPPSAPVPPVTPTPASTIATDRR